MSKVKFPGLGKASGVSVFPPMVEGVYTFEAVKPPAITPNKKDSSSLDLKLELVVLDGPEQDNGKDPSGRKFTHFLFVMGPEHPKFDPDNNRSANDLKAMLNAFGVQVDSKDQFNPEDFVGAQARGKVIIEEPAEGREEYGPQNRVRRWFPAEA